MAECSRLSTSQGTVRHSWRLILSYNFLCRDKDDIWKVLEDLIVFESGDEDYIEPMVTTIAPLTSLGKIGISLQAVAAFGYMLEPLHFHKINKRILDDVTRWITHVFRLQNNNVHFHDDPLESLVRLSRMVLHLRYPKYLEDGYLALAQQPVFYGAMQSSLGVLQLICRVVSIKLNQTEFFIRIIFLVRIAYVMFIGGTCEHLRINGYRGTSAISYAGCFSGENSSSRCR